MPRRRALSRHLPFPPVPSSLAQEVLYRVHQPIIQADKGRIRIDPRESAPSAAIRVPSPYTGGPPEAGA